MRRFIAYLLPGLLLISCTPEWPENNAISFMDHLIGTAPATTISALKHGHGTENYSQVVPYITAPFGMTNWTPQTRDTQKKCVAPYYYTDSIFREYEIGKGRRALESYLEYGYVPLEDPVKESFHQNEQVSRTLDYAFDDFALGRIAEKLGKYEDLAALQDRTGKYKNAFSIPDSCVRGRYADGSWMEEYNKYEKQPYITEGTLFQYTWYVPHDFAGLIALMGGEEGFNRNLDHFHASGQYWHGNETDHQITFLYNYSGQPWKTQQLVGEIMEAEYGTGPGRLSGNDDAGQMSAWHVFAALGFYPVCPSVPEYVISGPHFDKITLDLGTSTLVQNAPGASYGKNYIQKIEVIGRKTSDAFFNHFELLEGGTIDFSMQDSPSKNRGTAIEARPFSFSTEQSKQSESY